MSDKMFVWGKGNGEWRGVMEKGIWGMTRGS